MKIAITSTGTDLNSDVCPRFGRADYFIIIDPESLEFEAIDNPNTKAVGGAGIQSSQMMINYDVSAVLSGRIGMNAYRVLESAGISVFENVEGSVKEVVELFNKNGLVSSNTPGPGRNRHRAGNKNSAVINSNNDADEITRLKSEVEELTKKLNNVNEKLNRLNK